MVILSHNATISILNTDNELHLYNTFERFYYKVKKTTIMIHDLHNIIRKHKTCSWNNIII